MADNQTVIPHRGMAFQFRHNKKLVGTAFVLALIFWNFGFDGGITSGLLGMPLFITHFGTRKLPDGSVIMTPTDISVFATVPNAGIFLALPISAFAADRWGRKWMLYIACALTVVGAALQTVAINMAIIVVGRTLGFTATFIYLSIGTGWLAEISPPEVRGMFVSFSIIVIDLAAVVTAGISKGTESIPNASSYRIPLGLQLVWPVVIAVGALFIWDSPTFHLIKGQDELALKSLRSIRGGYTELEIQAELEALRAQDALRQQDEEVSWKELFKGVNLRRTFLALAIANFQQLSGISYATTYATIFLRQVAPGQDPFVLNIGLAVLAFGGACIGLLLVDRIGRRTLALSTFGALFVINIVIGGLGFGNPYENKAIGQAIAAFSLMFAFFYAAGFGPLTYVAISEMSTARLRNKTSSASFFCLIAFATVVSYVLPYISQSTGANLGAKTYLIFAGWMLITLVTIFLYFPETKGRSPAEIDEMFAARIPARQFKSYVCSTATINFAQENLKEAVLVHEEEQTQPMSK